MNCYRKMLRGKIHRATVTHADLNYEGSISVAPELLSAAGILANEAVQVWNITRGTRFETYAIAGESNTCHVCVNGAAAHLVEIGDLIIIAAFIELHNSELEGYSPKVVFVDCHNKITSMEPEIAGPNLRKACN